MTFTVTDAVGASANTTRLLTVVEVAPVARFDESPAVPILGQSITFDGSGSSDVDSTSGWAEAAWALTRARRLRSVPVVHLDADYHDEWT